MSAKPLCTFFWTCLRRVGRVEVSKAVAWLRLRLTGPGQAMATSLVISLGKLILGLFRLKMAKKNSKNCGK